MKSLLRQFKRLMSPPEPHTPAAPAANRSPAPPSARPPTNGPLEQHAATTPGGILCLASEDTYNDVSMFADSRENVQAIRAAEFRDDLPTTPDLVICVGKDNAQTHSLYALTNSLKDRGVPVVFGNPQRALILTAPTWRDVDLHMSGMFYLADMYIRGIGARGSYAEFGVFDGRSMSLAYHALKSSVDNFIGFDSFAGIVGSRADEKTLFENGAYYANIETFWHNMGVAGVDKTRVRAIRGSFQETLIDPVTMNTAEKISICYIDSDVYEPAKLALNFVRDRLLPGALILFDEYHAFGADPNRGERRAVAEWLRENPDISLEHYRNYTAVGAAFIFHRCAKGHESPE